MKINRREVAIVSLSLSVSLVAFLLLSTAVNLLYPVPSGPNEKLPLTGSLKVMVDNKTVYSADTVMLLDYDYFFCKVFNDTNACNGAGAYYSGGAAPNCQIASSFLSATTVDKFFSGSDCSELGVVLSTDSTTQASTNYACSAQLSGSGLSGVKATTTHITATNSIMLTATWTYSGTSQGNIQKVCLFPWNDASNAINIPSNNGAVAVDTFTAQTLTNGQSLTIEWTFTL